MTVTGTGARRTHGRGSDGHLRRARRSECHASSHGGHLWPTSSSNVSNASSKRAPRVHFRPTHTPNLHDGQNDGKREYRIRAIAGKSGNLGFFSH